jgi:hypothetical protein
MNHSKDPQAPLCIFLDQKDWIDLARGYYRRSEGLEDFARYALKLSESCEAVFPLSITHFGETIMNLNDDRRKRLSDFMILLSRGATIAPSNIVMDFEIVNACLKHIGVELFNIHDWVIGRGVSHMVGAKGSVLTPSLPENIVKELEAKIENEEVLSILLKAKYGQEVVTRLREPADKAVKISEEIRREESTIENGDLRHRVAMEKFFRNSLDPKIVKYLLSIGKTPEILMKTLISVDTVIEFLKSMPTAYSLFTLTFYRDHEVRSRPIQPNDINDIMGLSVAIPYTDIVVTEGMWRDAIIRRRLKPKNKVLDSIQGLKKCVENVRSKGG